jgi:hypothetical protein
MRALKRTLDPNNILNPQPSHPAITSGRTISGSSKDPPPSGPCRGRSAGAQSAEADRVRAGCQRIKPTASAPRFSAMSTPEVWFGEITPLRPSFRAKRCCLEAFFFQFGTSLHRLRTLGSRFAMVSLKSTAQAASLLQLVPQRSAFLLPALPWQFLRCPLWPQLGYRLRSG